MIQDASVVEQTLLTTFDGDYKMAVVHIAWDRDRANTRTLLFAFVELLPVEVPPPHDDYAPKGHSSHRLGGASEHTLYVRHAVATARDALKWYLGARDGSAVLPNENGDVSTKPLVIQALDEEPRWPCVRTMSDASDALPFRPHWMRCPRAHHLLPREPMDLGRLWSEGGTREARAWLGKQLHFDLEAYEEYWGSIHLVAPNPVYRRLQTRLHHRDGNESVLVRIWPRTGSTVTGFEMSVSESDALGTTARARVAVAQPVVRVNFTRALNMVKVDVEDSERGVLETSDSPHAFIRAFQLDVAIQRKVVVQSGQSSYEVLRSSGLERSVGGASASKPSARSRLIGAHYERRKREIGRQHDQRWFRGQREEGRSFLRDILHNARREVLLVDAYFGATELVEFSLSVGREDVPVRMLTSSEELKKKTGDIDKGRALMNVVGQVRARFSKTVYEARVMGGERPVIHDRFLVVDDRVWSIGCSFNEFGSRGTMMIALPDPAPVRQELHAVWANEAEALEEWIARRAAAAAGEPT
jgi:hypothetical protein